METRKLAGIIVSFLNALVGVCEEAAEMINKELAKGDSDEPAKEKKKSEKPARPSRSAKAKEEEEEVEEEEEEEEEETDDEVSADAVVDAARAALKVLDRADVSKIIKKYGKADKASEVDAEHRQKTIDALEKAVDAV